MRVGIRVDASLEIGTGHLRRCMTLAAALISKGADVRFVIRRHDTVAELALRSAGFTVSWLDAPSSPTRRATETVEPRHASWAGVGWSDDADETVEVLASFRPDWMILDHYSFDAKWHERVRQRLACEVMAIDDLADRSLSVEVLLDANFSEDHAGKYAGRLAGRCQLLGGPRFALLSTRYRTASRYEFRPDVHSIGIFMGGTDPDGVTARVLRTCREFAGFRGTIEVVSTSASPHLDQLRKACLGWANTTLSLDLPDLSAFYSRHDLQIGAGGTATYERCCLGAPTIALAVAPNQLAVIPALDARGVLRAARLTADPDADILPAAPYLGQVIQALVADPEARRDLSERGMSMVDARGADRVAICLLRDTLGLRRVTADDGPQLHAWRNHPTVRAVSGNGEPIPLNAHMAWLANKLADDNARLYIAEIGGTAVGSIRFDRLDGGDTEVSLYLDPDLPGLGLGPRLLLSGEKAVTSEWAGGTGFTASVMPDNEASARLFINCGYSGGPLRFNKAVTADA
ncbi:MAG: UDP-2,4-diacetamido-2,4,6-trideoxy-beta-L-altropyranose hydrolase [Alphaproteobacteria bacterium]|jgi:UDP-2,4-diacetamido-2,4,6-trideoxy-beta-L-altropyranose hydrolase|nr:UDP-2,4-diacetamido-2,4,6-trideoxy-beta-L-altropyranose hydrolase [Alphaproteobacteria bacterium]MBU2040793.1 UDP-2,4-diacetamido-2,4,6-trideoxy-beta-L-altropyranose hydrolase [Alphaproteobacteria bacterium]MBU2207903.1 UDP-2,4-diacetamido-2,4,6-trideoxy-beta-L-altropyranose hydrolase [Alphaproteobacteria bacterium]MBU2291266.1 UDP-2,4-diacetamido-2,4,6-trideoxy-beta-L-altropyranose hydrolase [Alphaproteobacteria bacterium]MBU2396700.1 UDP-2,4-diacetamido-2,4,6-trideoxy-beta-L-altropyranose 